MFKWSLLYKRAVEKLLFVFEWISKKIQKIIKDIKFSGFNTYVLYYEIVLYSIVNVQHQWEACISITHLNNDEKRLLITHFYFFTGRHEARIVVAAGVCCYKCCSDLCFIFLKKSFLVPDYPLWLTFFGNLLEFQGISFLWILNCECSP